jgi:hypothetical protein
VPAPARGCAPGRGRRAHEGLNRLRNGIVATVLEILQMAAVLHLGVVEEGEMRPALRRRQLIIVRHREELDEGVPDGVLVLFEDPPDDQSALPCHDDDLPQNDLCWRLPHEELGGVCRWTRYYVLFLFAT